MFRFLHAADIHLDSPLRGIARHEGLAAEEIRLASRRAFDNLVRLALEEKVRLVLLAGDLYDGDWRDSGTGMFFSVRMSRLREAGIAVCVAAGNHDAANRMTRSLRLPDNVHVFSERRAETWMPREGGVAVHGQSFRTPHVFENLAAGYPARAPGCFNIGLLHTSVSGYEGHEPYAPCTLEELRLKEYDYWALGHVHARQELSLHPRILFPGNLQGRNIRETGPKGCTLVSVGDGLEILGCQHRTLDVVRWEVARVDAAGARAADELNDRALNVIRGLRAGAGDRPLVVRVEIEGATGLHHWLAGEAGWRAELRALAAADPEPAWIEKIVVRTRPPGEQEAPPGPLAEVREFVRRLAGVNRTEELAGDLLNKLPEDLRLEAASWLDPAGPRYRGLLAEAESLVMERLRGQGGQP